MSKPVTDFIKIMLIDDHTIVRAGLRMLIESQSNLTVVGEAGNRIDSLAIAARVQPDIILLDLDMGGESSLDFLPELLVTASRASILILTGIYDLEQYRRALRLGATGLLLKDKAAEVLITAIEKVNSGEVWIDRMVVANVFSKSPAKKKVEKTAVEADKVATLTPREREVIGLVGKGFTNKQIAEKLFISHSTARHHVESLYSKLGVSSRFQLILYAYRHGLANLPF